MNKISISFDSQKGEKNLTRIKNSYILEYPCFSADECDPYKIKLSQGTYKIECWGSASSAKGGYTKGLINIQKEETFYAYIGTRGKFNSIPPFADIYNGNIGGGATDIRLTDDSHILLKKLIQQII